MIHAQHPLQDQATSGVATLCNLEAGLGKIAYFEREVTCEACLRRSMVFKPTTLPSDDQHVVVSLRDGNYLGHYVTLGSTPARFAKALVYVTHLLMSGQSGSRIRWKK